MDLVRKESLVLSRSSLPQSRYAYCTLIGAQLSMVPSGLKEANYTGI